jgi:HK97 family phage portal protein
MGDYLMAIEGIPGWVTQLQGSAQLSGTREAYRRVPMVYRCVNLRADAIASVPFVIERNGQATEWPFETDLQTLIKETEKSLLLRGAAYWVKQYNGRALVSFQQLNAWTVRMRFNEQSYNPMNPMGALSFEQNIHGKTYGPWAADQMLYFRESSMDDDMGPGLAATEVAMQAAQLAHYVERFASAFFEHGAQPVTIISMPADTAEPEFKRFMQNWVQRFTGVLNSFRTAFVRGGDIKAQVITPAIKDLMLTELTNSTTTTMSTTFGVPRTMLEASAANYATANSDRQSFWRETIIPRLPLFEHVLNTQLLNPLGYDFRFNPEALEVMQADEAARASSLVQLTNAGVPLPDAMTILGYDIEGITFATIDTQNQNVPPAVETPPEGVVDESQQQGAKALQIESGQNTPETNSNALAGDSGALDAISDDVMDDMVKFERKIVRRIKAGRGPFVDYFTTNKRSRAFVDAVSSRLYEGVTVGEVKAICKMVKATLNTPLEKWLYKRIKDILKAEEARLLTDITNDKYPQADIGDRVRETLIEGVPMSLKEVKNKLNADTPGLVPFGAIVPANVQGRVVDYLRRYTIPKQLDATTGRIVDNAVAAYRATPGMTLKDLQGYLAAAVDPARAKAIAITETTRMATQTTQAYAEELRNAGVDMTEVWQTNYDEDVCEECGPLEGKLETAWPPDYKAGPPAHVNCRCTVGLRLSDDAQEGRVNRDGSYSRRGA